MQMRRLLYAVALAVSLAACGTQPAAPPASGASLPVAMSASAAPRPTATPPSPSPSPSPSASPRRPTRPASPSRSAARSRRTAAGWSITVYYTVVEDYHGGAPTRVTGCRRLDCTRGRDDLGTHPADFVAAVKDEGTGVTSDGRYLNWSYDTGFWLDTAPRNADGKPLERYVSAAADPDVLAHGTRFTIANCGRQDDGSPPAPAVCAAFRRAVWRIDDEFTPGLGGRRHVDLYVGRETGPGFTDSDAYVSTTGATLRF